MKPDVKNIPDYNAQNDVGLYTAVGAAQRKSWKLVE